MTDSELPTIAPEIGDFVAERTRSKYTVLCGPNNCGKSFVLKSIKKRLGQRAYLIGVSRFYHVPELSPRKKDESEIQSYEASFNSHFADHRTNQEQNQIDLNRSISKLTNEERSKLFELASDLLGVELAIKSEDPNNEMSPKYIDMDGKNVSVGSTGTRLLLTILAICMDDRFEYILIDEPELGLSPRIQSVLCKLFQDNEKRRQYLPHLKQMYVASHSSLFLSRSIISDNYSVSMADDTIQIGGVENMSQFHDLQFSLLGNELESLFLPSAILIVEGETDHDYIKHVVQLKNPAKRISVVRAGDDSQIKRKVHSLKEFLGDFFESPFKDRVFAVLDETHQSGLPAELERMGMLDENVVVWDNNGIEYVYPTSVMADIFRCSPEELSISISGDEVSVGTVTLKKKELCEKVVAKVTDETQLPNELQTSLLNKVASAVS